MTTPEDIAKLNEISERSVVILGSKFFKDHIIEKISAILLDNKLSPSIAFKVQEDFDIHFTPRQRIYWFLSNSRFVIAEDSIPSGEMVELEYCKNLGVTTAILHDENLPRSSWMTLDVDIHGADFRCFPYNKDNLAEKIKESINWANERNKIKKEAFEKSHKEWNEKNKVFENPKVKEAMNILRDIL